MQSLCFLYHCYPIFLILIPKLVLKELEERKNLMKKFQKQIHRTHNWFLKVNQNKGP